MWPSKEEDIEWIHQRQKWDLWQVLVHKVINWTAWATVSYSRTMLHVVRQWPLYLAIWTQWVSQIPPPPPKKTGHVRQIHISHQNLLCMLSKVFIAEKAGVGEKGSGYTRTVDVDTLGTLYEYGPEICLFQQWSFFLVKSKSFQSWVYSSKVSGYQDFQIIRCQVQGILLYTYICFHVFL